MLMCRHSTTHSSNPYSIHMVGHTSVLSACFYCKQKLSGSLQEYFSKNCWIPCIVFKVYFTTVCLILLQSLCNMTYFANGAVTQPVLP